MTITGFIASLHTQPQISLRFAAVANEKKIGRMTDKLKVEIFLKRLRKLRKERESKAR